MKEERESQQQKHEQAEALWQEERTALCKKVSGLTKQLGARDKELAERSSALYPNLQRLLKPYRAQVRVKGMIRCGIDVKLIRYCHCHCHYH